MIQHTIWNEKWRATNLDDFLTTPEIRDKFKSYIAKNDIPHLIFAGQTGSGKTTIAKILAKNLDCDYTFINASDENGIDTIREKVKNFCSGASFKPLKVVILDESDYLTVNAQSTLRNVIETYSRSTRFIFTCNYLERMMDAIQSRCDVYKLEPPSKEEIYDFVGNILEKEGKSYLDVTLQYVIDQQYPDIRKIINTVQSCSTGNTLKVSRDLSKNYISEITAIFDKPSKSISSDIEKLRQIIVDNDVRDFQELYKIFYEKYLTKPEVIVLLAEYQYKQAFVIDKEINFVACASKILETLKKPIYG